MQIVLLSQSIEMSTNMDVKVRKTSTCCKLANKKPEEHTKIGRALLVLEERKYQSVENR